MCTNRMVSFSLVVAVVLLAAQARAQVYDFTYSDSSGDAAYGQLTVQPSGLGDGSVWATSGTIDVTAAGITPVDGSLVLGSYPLLTSVSIGTKPTNSPSGKFIADDLLYPANDAGGDAPSSYGISNPSYLSNFGLLFGPSSQTGGQDEVNIFGNGGGDYGFFTSVGSNYNVEVRKGGIFTVSLVPEPGTLTLLGSALFGLGGAFYLRRRRAKA